MGNITFLRCINRNSHSVCKTRNIMKKTSTFGPYCTRILFFIRTISLSCFVIDVYNLFRLEIFFNHCIINKYEWKLYLTPEEETVYFEKKRMTSSCLGPHSGLVYGTTSKIYSIFLIHLIDMIASFQSKIIFNHLCKLLFSQSRVVYRISFVQI